MHIILDPDKEPHLLMEGDVKDRNSRTTNVNENIFH